MYNDLTSMTFNYLTALSMTGERNINGECLWLFRCSCGKTHKASGTMVKRGFIKSCGCLRTKKLLRHGLRKAPEYRVWSGMLQRCKNQKEKSFVNYGGRGISVCKRWYNFENFLTDMGKRPPGLSLDRINNNGNYEPGNCRWATKDEQLSNRRNSVHYAYEGKNFTASQLAKKLNVNYEILRGRLRLGWSIEEACRGRA